MPFILICRDATDPDCINRRLANRDAHLAMVAEAVKNGKQIFGIAITDDAGKMIGSVMIMTMETRAEIDAWLKVEPYVTGKVWDDIEVLNGVVPQTFAHFFKQK